MSQQRSLRSNNVIGDVLQSVTLDSIRTIVEESKVEVLQSIQSVRDEFLQLRNELRNLDVRMQGLETSLNEFRNVQDSHREEIFELKSAIESAKDIQNDVNPKSLLQEVEDREKRRKNVIINGLPEKTDGTVKERQEFDINCVKEMFQHLGLNHLNTATTHRFGKIKKDKVRPVKVRFRDTFSKEELLRKSKDLSRSIKFRNAFVSRDLTQSQQQQQYQLRQELRRQRDAGLDVVIYNGQVLPRNSINKNFHQ